MDCILLQGDFTSFPIGSFPYDHAYTAMGEYHYYPAQGYTGQWYDPTVNANYRGPSWLITEVDGDKYMEQMRVRNPLTKNVSPLPVAGEVEWRDYTAQVKVRPLCTTEEAGLIFRYQTSLMNYAPYLNDQKVQFRRVHKKNRYLIAEVEHAFTSDEHYLLEAECRGNHFTGGINGETVLTIEDSDYTYGKIAISSYMPAQFTDVLVRTSEESYETFLKEEREKELRVTEKRSEYTQPKLHKVIDLKNYGVARQIRFGHLMGGDDWYFIMTQHQKHIHKDRYFNISCLTTVNMGTGEILWQVGEPSGLKENQNVAADLPFQVYGIDGDGYDEVIMARGFKLMVLDGRMREVGKWIHTPMNGIPGDQLLGVEFQKYGFNRLNVDAVRIVNVSGNEHPPDILIKDRYSRLWVYNSDLELLWKFNYKNTGHFPYGYDFNGDGKDEIFSCHNMMGSDGNLIWILPIEIDHTDEIIVGKFDPDEDEMIAMVSDWRGLMIVDKQGNIRHRDLNGHGQRISAANYCPDRRGLEICTTTYWEYQGIIYLHDYKGNELWHMEPGSNGNIIAPVNWQGDGMELILLNGSIKYEGMLNGDGDVVVTLPGGGHPDLCAEVINMTGDTRDEIVLWDTGYMFTYIQDRPCAIKDREYIPEKYPHYNSSNYRGEYSPARWTRRTGEEHEIS